MIFNFVINYSKYLYYFVYTPFSKMHKFYNKLFPKDHKSKKVNREEKERIDRIEKDSYFAYPSNDKYNGPT